MQTSKFCHFLCQPIRFTAFSFAHRVEQVRGQNFAYYGVRATESRKRDLGADPERGLETLPLHGRGSEVLQPEAARVSSDKNTIFALNCIYASM
jgi:hypothetical protein